MPPNQRVAAATRLLCRGGGNTRFEQGMVSRNRTGARVTTSSASTPAPHSAKTSQSWKYSGGVIDRGTHLPKKYVDHKDRSKARRKQESNFFITINTNKEPDEGGYVERAFVDTLRHISSEGEISKYIKFGPYDDEYRDDKYSEVVVKRDWKAARIETGDIMNRLHAHIWVTFEHYSQMQINVHVLAAEVKRVFNDKVGDSRLKITRKPFVHVKLLPQSNWTSIMKQYIHKGMTGC